MMLILFSDFLPLALESHGFLGLLLTLLVGSTFPFEDEISLQKLGPLALGVLLAVHMADRLPTNLRDFRSEEQTFHHKDLPVPPNTLLESKLSNYSAPLSEVLKKTRSTTQLSNCAFSIIFLYICIYIYISNEPSRSLWVSILFCTSRSSHHLRKVSQDLSKP